MPPKNQTINKNVYCATLGNLRRAIQNKRREMLSRGIILFHDNVRPHTANDTQKFIWLETI